MSLIALTLALAVQPPQDFAVKDVQGLRSAAAKAQPGTRILLEPGEYAGGVHIENLKGAAMHPIVIGAVDPKNPPRIVGGGSGLQLSDVSYLEVRDLTFEKPRGNGLNIDDGGTIDTPSHDVVIRNIRVSDLPAGNNDGIKLSGLNDFVVTNCTVDRWGGSAIDMVGCHRGAIRGSTFRNGGDSAVQCKGGSSDIIVELSRFENFGQRGVNIGGSTGIPYFRPAVDKMPAQGKYEAKDIRVEGNTFVGGVSPINFVGVDGARVRFNTIYHPRRWAIRILQETRAGGFVPSRKGVFEDNLVVFCSDQWASGGVNIGDGTAPGTFTFARNFWFCTDGPTLAPALPTKETGGVIGQDPMMKDPAKGDYSVRPGSPAAQVGAHAPRDRKQLLEKHNRR